MIELYEKLYFHEIEIRDKLVERLHIPLALIVSLMGAMTYMLMNTNLSTPLPSKVPFFFLLSIPALLLLATCITFFLSYYNYTYGLIPTAQQLSSYMAELKELYANEDNCDELCEHYFDEALKNYFIECASLNAQTNSLSRLRKYPTGAASLLTQGLVFR